MKVTSDDPRLVPFMAGLGNLLHQGQRALRPDWDDKVKVSPAEALAKRYIVQQRQEFIDHIESCLRSGNDHPVTRIWITVPGLGALPVNLLRRRPKHVDAIAEANEAAKELQNLLAKK